MVVGLWNFGSKYENTRHNIWFDMIEKINNYFNIWNWIYESRFLSDIVFSDFDNTKIVFCKPKTYMNLSGNAVLAIKSFYKIESNNILVLHDDIDLWLGILKIKSSWWHAWHNGIRDIIAKIWTDQFLRLRIWIDRPKNLNINISDYVLSKFTNSELDILDSKFDIVKDVFYNFIKWIKNG